MIKNYLVTFLRKLWRNKTFFTINVLSLSIGISAALAIFLVVYYELSYDHFEPDAASIYRVVLDVKMGGMEGHSAGVQAPLANVIQKEVTGIEQTVPLMQFQGDGTAKVTIVQKGVNEPSVFKNQPDIVFTNPQYFSLLPFSWTAGAASVLQNPFTVVMTEKRAHEYFPKFAINDVIGKQVRYNDDITVTVSGIVKDLQEQTLFNGEEFISYATISQTHLQDRFMMNVWNDWMAYSQLYVKIRKGIDAVAIESQLKTLLHKYNPNANNTAANSMAFHLQPLKDVHFNNSYQGVGQPIVHLPTLYGLLAIAAILLLLGCINFINLTTANAAQRAKEIGIRKTMGSSRKQLIVQFLGETFMVTCTASLLSVCLLPFLLRLFPDFVPEGLHFSSLHIVVLLFLLLITLVVTFLSGIYPALVLSNYKPVLVLKSQFAGSPKTRHSWLRKTLTIAQFAIAQFFVIATIMVSKQINYSLNADLGFNKEGIITFDVPRDTVVSHTQLLLNAIQSIPEVEVVSSGFLSPADVGVAITKVVYKPKKDIDAQVQFRWGNPAYMDVYKIKLLAGRNVLPSDTMREFIINETYSKLLGFHKPEEALGKMLSFNNKEMPVVGVMQDFHDQSTHSKIFPLLFSGGNGNTFHVRLKENVAGANTWQNAIHKIRLAYKNVFTDTEFSYRFYDQTIEAMYAKELQTANLLAWATGLSIFISCLGLLGLVMFTINTRTKEIGIRKILGATVSNVITALSIDFVKPIFFAFLIAVPLAWMATYQWLQDYAYRTGMSWWIFALAGVGMILIALITLIFQTTRAALANPVKSLRTE